MAGSTFDGCTSIVIGDGMNAGLEGGVPARCVVGVVMEVGRNREATAGLNTSDCRRSDSGIDSSE